MQIHDQLFDSVPAIRYVATKQGTSVQLRQRESITDASDNESDRYEELLVNPAILQLAKSRGDIDCGGMDFVIIRYGNFFQFVQPMKDGHISIAFEINVDLNNTIKQIQTILHVDD